jgi:hypothetical protein
MGDAPEVQLSGTVRGVQARTEVSGGGDFATTSTTVLVFRLEPLDGSRPVNVEIRGSRLDGTVVDGEVVDVTGHYAAAGFVQARRIVSRETGTALVAEVPPSGCRALLFIAGFLLAVLLIVLGVVWASNTFGSNGRKHRGTPEPAPSATLDPVQRAREIARERCFADDRFSDAECRRLFATP